MNKCAEWRKKEWIQRADTSLILIGFLSGCEMNFWYCPRFQFTHHIYTCRMNVSKFELGKRFAPIAWEKRLKIFFSRHSERPIPKHFFFSFVDELKKKLFVRDFFSLVFRFYLFEQKNKHNKNIEIFIYRWQTVWKNGEQKKIHHPMNIFQQVWVCIQNIQIECVHTFWWFLNKFGANHA